MRRVTYIFLILVIAYLSALPLVTKASTNTNSTMQVVGNLSLVKSEVPEEDEETPLEEQRTILKEENLPNTGGKKDLILIICGLLLLSITILTCRLSKQVIQGHIKI
ncbi:LPXTG cell wall anchor domain-containing protein [Lactococcus petauri]|uniref:LPXTG cell wall anchor domain-containing protein n=1 Tax=Lactococcus petauri TaxID=1940789 RepID=UPI00254DD9F1|nr:LPXTG cell wall anchor domain-containing protein [Lactococcus petauri]